MAKNFKFKGGGRTTQVLEILKEVDFGGGTQITIGKSKYQTSDGQTNHTIVVSGIGKDTRMGPQKALAIIATAEEIEAYFREVGVIE